MRFTDPDFVALLRARGMPVAERIGHGTYGAVFEHATKPDTVIKVTTSAPEARAARYIAGHTLFGVSPHVCLPCIGNFHDVSHVRLTGYRGDGQIWAFEREALADWDPAVVGLTWFTVYKEPRAVQDGFRAAIGILLDAVVHCTELGSDWTVPGLIARDRQIKQDVWPRYAGYDAVRALQTYDGVLRGLGAIRRDMQDFAEWCKDRRIGLRDLDRENWGVRPDGRVVVRDIGGLCIPP